MDQKRDAPISYRPPEARRAELGERIARSGLTTNAFITAAVFGEVPVRRARRSTTLERQMLGELLSQAARIHDALTPLKTARGAPAPAITEALRELVEIRTCLLLALGKDP
jgi:hypothetical protein